MTRPGPSGLPRLGPPLAVRIVGLLIGGLVVAQLATLTLTVLLPPTPPAQYRLQDIAIALGGLRVQAQGARPLMRSVRPAPPSLRSAGWLVSERSRQDLARLLGVGEGDVRLLFYSPLPFAGASGLALAPSVPLVGGEARRVDAAYAFEAPPGGGGFGGGFGGSRAEPPGGFEPGSGGASTGQGLGQGRDGRGFGDRAGRGAGAGGAGGGPGGGGLGGRGAGQTPLWAQRLQDGAGRSGLGTPDRGALGGTAGATDGGSRSGGYGGLGPFTEGGRGEPGALGGAPFAGLGALQGTGLGGAARGGAGPVEPSAGQRPLGLGAHLVRGGGGSGLLAGSAVSELASPSAPVAASSSDAARRIPTAPPAAASEPRVADLRIHPLTSEAPAGAAMVDPAFGARAAELGLIAPASVVAERSGDAAGWVVNPPVRQTRGLFGLAPSPFVQGDFVAAVKTGPTQWVTVQPRPEPFPNSWQRRVLLWFVLASAMVVPLGWLFARRLARPLGEFAAAAERLGRDPTGAVMTLSGPAEIGRAARAFNGMQARLKRFVDDRTGMVGAISHDLRTPLARMRFRIERVPPELKAGMLEDVRQMEEMISSVLTFIRDVSEPAARERVDLRSIVECVVDDAALVGGEAVLDPGAPLSVECDALGVQRVLANLVDNALKYGRRAEVRMFAEAGEAVAEVVDDGPGLPPEELERVFQPFYRSAASRTLNSGGIGLGLAVSRSIARAHGGDVRLRPGATGLVAQLRLPLALPVAVALKEAA